MKIITVPAAISVKLPKGEPEDVDFKKFLTIHLDSYSAVKTPSQVRQIVKVMDAVEKGNGTISLEDAEYEVLKGACNEVKYIPLFARQLVAFWDAVDKAEDVKK